MSTFSTPVKFVIILLGLELAYYTCKSLYNYLTRNSSSRRVLFFNNRSAECFVTNHQPELCKRALCTERNLRQIKDHLLNAKQTIDVCMYRLSFAPLTNALQSAIRKGITVRIITDAGGDREESREVMALRQCGAFVRLKSYEQGSRRDVLIMHHKFVVVDGSLLMTGSLNWTRQAVCGNWENFAFLFNAFLISAFQEEFKHLWEHHVPQKLDTLNAEICPTYSSIPRDWREEPVNQVYIFREYTAPCRAHMSLPKFRLQDKAHAPFCAFTALRTLCDLIKSAKESLDVCTLLLTLENVSGAFIDALLRDVRVRIITDVTMAALSGSQIKGLTEAGIEVRGLQHQNNMHHKFIVIDNKLVLFGSLNWSMQAFCGNSENVVCTNENAIVREFKDHFDELWTEFPPIDVPKIGVRSLRMN